MNTRHNIATESPLAVDLEGTLIHTSLAWEGLTALLRHKPWMIFACAFWALRGRAFWKYRMAETVSLEADALPYNSNIVGFLQLQRARGRKIYLSTEANQRWAEQIAAHLGIFDGVIGSTYRYDNSGERKARCCVEMFGEGEFDYLGRHEESIHAMRAGRLALALGPVPQNAGFTPRVTFAAQQVSAFTVLRALRIKQWPKNLLLFVPLLVSLQWTNVPAVLATLLATVAFCFAASGSYLVNDLADLAADRKHTEKRNRPVASGRLSIPWTMALAASLFTAAFGLAALLPGSLVMILGCYVAGSAIYSLWLKRVAIVDIVMLTALSLLRVYAGSAVSETAVSSWLLLFSVAVFLSLALLQRVSGEETTDTPLLTSMGISAAMIAVAILALYISSANAELLYHQPQYLWVPCAALFCWIHRLWLAARAKSIGSGLVWLALSDKFTYLALAATLTAMTLAR